MLSILLRYKDSDYLPLVSSNSSFSVWYNKYAFIDNRILRGINIARLEWNNIYMWRSDKNEVKITLYYINLNHYYDDGIGILSSPACSSVNIIYNFYYALRYRRSSSLSITYTLLCYTKLHLPFIQKALGMNYIQTKLLSQPLSKMHSLSNLYLGNAVWNPNTSLQ